MGGSLGRRALAEFIGTALLVTAVIGSGTASRLSPHDIGLKLFENAAATSAARWRSSLRWDRYRARASTRCITLLDRAFSGVSSVAAAGYIAAQVVGATAGAVIANLMFGFPAVQVSTHVRSGGGLWLGEVVATFGLALVVFGVVPHGTFQPCTIRGRRLHRRCLFLHLVDQLRKSRNYIRTNVLEHLRGHRAVIGRGIHRLPARRRPIAAVAIRILYPDSSTILPAVVLPHDQTTNASSSMDRTMHRWRPDPP